MAELESAEVIAEARGRAAAVVDAHLAEHDRHFRELNGSVGRLATAQETMVREALKATVAQEERDRLAGLQRDAIQEATAQTFTRRQVLLGAIVTAAAVASAVFTATGNL